jgi:hypothetical protein
MATNIVTLELPVNVYDKLQKLADEEQTDPVDIIVRLVEEFTPLRPVEPEEDPVFELIGAYHSDRPLIDDIPVSEDPDLYLTAELIGERSKKMHSWEVAPARYRPHSEKDTGEADA